MHRTRGLIDCCYHRESILALFYSDCIRVRAIKLTLQEWPHALYGIMWPSRTIEAYVEALPVGLGQLELWHRKVEWCNQLVSNCVCARNRLKAMRVLFTPNSQLQMPALPTVSTRFDRISIFFTLYPDSVHTCYIQWLTKKKDEDEVMTRSKLDG